MKKLTKKKRKINQRFCVPLGEQNAVHNIPTI